MRAVPIRINDAKAGIDYFKASFQKNWKHYLQEAFGLAIFMISACLFTTLFESKGAYFHKLITTGVFRNIIIGLLMGGTALLIFYSPLTAPSGAHINPAVTISFWRLGKIGTADAIFYCIFQVMGGTLAVYLMQWIIGKPLTEMPVNSCATIPLGGITAAAVTEFLIAFATMSMVLFTSHHAKLRKYTRVFAGCLVCLWVITAGPVSGFGMNPARSFASALPSNTWTGFWIYLLVPFAGMLLATVFFKIKTSSEFINSKNELQ